MKDDGMDMFHMKCGRQSKIPEFHDGQKNKKILMTLVAKCVVNELVHSPHPTDASKNAGQIQQKSKVTASLQGLTKSLTSKQQMAFMEE